MAPTASSALGSSGAAGGRSFSCRVAQALPERFHVNGVVTRTPERAEEVRTGWGVNAYSNLEDLLKHDRPHFVVLSVPRSVVVDWVGRLVAAGVPVLCETPPAEDLDGLRRVTELVAHEGRVQVAEQYQYQPLHAARLALTDDGAIGRVAMASLSACHDYHAFSLMRRHLRVTGEPAVVRATTLRSTVESGLSRSGQRRARGTVDEVRTTGLVEFGSGLGVYDFASEQYFSYIRSPRVTIRGTSGEIADHERPSDTRSRRPRYLGAAPGTRRARRQPGWLLFPRPFPGGQVGLPKPISGHAVVRRRNRGGYLHGADGTTRMWRAAVLRRS